MTRLVVGGLYRYHDSIDDKRPYLVLVTGDKKSCSRHPVLVWPLFDGDGDGDTETYETFNKFYPGTGHWEKL